LPKTFVSQESFTINPLKFVRLYFLGKSNITFVVCGNIKKIILVKVAICAILVLTVTGAPVNEAAKANPVAEWPPPYRSFYIIEVAIAITVILTIIIILLLYRRQRKSVNNHHSSLVKKP
jgi:hypothetical protein